MSSRDRLPTKQEDALIEILLDKELSQRKFAEVLKESPFNEIFPPSTSNRRPIRNRRHYLLRSPTAFKEAKSRYHWRKEEISSPTTQPTARQQFEERPTNNMASATSKAYDAWVKLVPGKPSAFSTMATKMESSDKHIKLCTKLRLLLPVFAPRDISRTLAALTEGGAGIEVKMPPLSILLADDSWAERINAIITKSGDVVVMTDKEAKEASCEIQRGSIVLSVTT
jgi:hypothetical protein